MIILSQISKFMKYVNRPDASLNNLRTKCLCVRSLVKWVPDLLNTHGSFLYKTALTYVY